MAQFECYVCSDLAKYLCKNCGSWICEDHVLNEREVEVRKEGFLFDSVETVWERYRGCATCETDQYLVERAPPEARGGHNVSVTQVVIKEVVKARCKYCSLLTPVDAKKCEHCGTPDFV